MFKVILFYKYVHIPDPQGLAFRQRTLCQDFSLKGRILVSEEGINATLEGLSENIDKYCRIFLEDPLFADIKIKISDGAGDSFPKLSVKVRNEIVASHLPNIDPRIRTGKYLTVEELHQWFESGKEFYIVDMRNDYETQAGHFQNSILSKMANFRYLPEFVESIRHLKDKTILTVCTGGVRCEKASAFLIENGFSGVYQLKDGIVTYMEKYPNQHFKGKLYVFDKRVLVGFNTESVEHEVIGRCAKCGVLSESYVNCAYDECHLHFICCDNCLENGKAFCQTQCMEKVLACSH